MTTTVQPSDAAKVAIAVGWLRMGVGAAVLLAPHLAARGLLRRGSDADAAVVALRAFAGRDLALGLGAVLAARRGPAALRGWVEAGGLADAVDAAALLADGGATVRRGLRPVVAGVAASSAAGAPLLARALTSD